MTGQFSYSCLWISGDWVIEWELFACNDTCEYILQWLDTDLTNKEIARELVVTTETIKLHTKHVYRKLSVNNRRAAVTLAKSLGLLATNEVSRG